MLQYEINLISIECCKAKKMFMQGQYVMKFGPIDTTRWHW
jgi:hypothetical protein